MKVTDALLGEHAAFYVLFDEIEAMAALAGGLPQIQSATTVLNALVLSHAQLEDDLLFGALEAVLGADGPQKLMRDEHADIDRLLEGIEDAVDAEDAAEWIGKAIHTAREHFRKEEEALFPLAQDVLGNEALENLGKAWATSRRVNIG